MFAGKGQRVKHRSGAPL